MIKELVISINNKEILTSILEAGKLSEFDKESIHNDFFTGGIYKGKIKNFISGLNGAFVDIGYIKNAFLHYQDLGTQVRSLINFYYNNIFINIENTYYGLSSFIFKKDINKNGRIEDVLSINQDLIVQIIKDPIGNKGPKITAEISLSGIFLVILPFSKVVLISKKIHNFNEKKRLINIIKNIKPYGFGVIIRTRSINKNYDILKSEMLYLENRWTSLCMNLSNNRLKNHCKLIYQEDAVYNVLRNYFDFTITSVICDKMHVYFQIKSYLYTLFFRKFQIVYLYRNFEYSLFEKYSVDRQIKYSLGKHIPLIYGSYIVIEKTEALHVIDVNSGSDYDDLKDSDVLKINLLAAVEISRQLRLRNLGGIVVVDFIDMKQIQYQKKLYDYFKKEMHLDKSKNELLPPSKFGLIQLIRHRSRKKTNIDMYNHHVNYNNIVLDPVFHIREIEFFLVKKRKKNKILYLHLHPFAASYLKYKFLSVRCKWLFIYKVWIIIIARYSFDYNEYKFINFI
jgi:ribonuclease G